MTQLAYRRDIDGLRAVAVVAVVLCHTGMPGFSGGFVGVDVFFVISGYLITALLMRDIAGGGVSLPRFWLARARRLLPALVVMLSATLAGGCLLFPPDRLEELAVSALATLGFVANLRILQTSGAYFGPAAEMDPLLHTWSLAVEEQFYLLFPLLLWVIARRGRRATLCLVASVTALSFLLSLRAAIHMPVAGYYLAPVRAWELGVGALLALLPGHGSGHRVRAVAGLAGLGMIAVVVLAYDAQVPFPGSAALLPCLGAGLVIWSGTGPAGWALSRAPMVGVGRISYSLYLWHWPAIVMARTLCAGQLTPIAAVSAVALSLPLAWLSWRFVEEPVRRGRVRLSLPAVGGAGVLLSCLALITTSGWPGRIPPEVLTRYERDRGIDPLQARCLEEDGLCRIGVGGEGPAALLLWGDSHAAALIPGVDLWLRERGLTGLAAVRAACPPLRGLDRADRPGTPGCAARAEAVLAALTARTDAPLVILHARWPQLVEGSRSAGEPGGDVVLTRASGGSEHGNNRILAASALRQTVSDLRASGRDVAIVEGVPETGWSVPEAMLLRDWRRLTPGAPPTKGSAGLRHAGAEAVFRDIPGVRRASLVPRLCDPVCRTESAEGALYRDDDHLSSLAARRLVPPLLDALIPDAQVIALTDLPRWTD